MAKTRKTSIDLCRLRQAVAFLGGKGQHGWWDSDFLSETGLQLLSYTFPRHPVLAGFGATCQAAQRFHDERIGQRATYHLFRLPSALEAEMTRISSEDGGRRLGEMERTQAAAMKVLTQLAAQTVDAPEGPVQVGTMRDIGASRGVEELAKHYLSAFQRGQKTLPFFGAQPR